MIRNRLSDRQDCDQRSTGGEQAAAASCRNLEMAFKCQFPATPQLSPSGGPAEELPSLSDLVGRRETEDPEPVVSWQ